MSGGTGGAGGALDGSTVLGLMWRGFLQSLPLIVLLLTWAVRVEVFMHENDYAAHRDRLLANDVPPPQVEAAIEELRSDLSDMKYLVGKIDERTEAILRVLED